MAMGSMIKRLTEMNRQAQAADERRSARAPQGRDYRMEALLERARTGKDVKPRKPRARRTPAGKGVGIAADLVKGIARRSMKKRRGSGTPQRPARKAGTGYRRRSNPRRRIY